MVYKLVEREGDDGHMHPVAKKSFGKSTDGWRKRGVRAYSYDLAQAELVVAGSTEKLDAWEAPEEVSQIRDLQITAIDHGDVDDSLATTEALFAAREYHKKALAELPITALSLSAGEPAIPTQVIELP
jgi:nicotinate phosphoribosyltransferase